MSYVKNENYRDLPLCEGAPRGDFYIYCDLEELASKCMYNEEVTKCRTIGILQSLNGRFYLTSLNSPNDLSEPAVQVSMVYMKTPPKSTVIPYPVQIFGTVQWKKRPVIFASIIQEMTPSLAIRMVSTLKGVTSLHLANDVLVPDEDCTIPG